MNYKENFYNRLTEYINNYKFEEIPTLLKEAREHTIISNKLLYNIEGNYYCLLGKYDEAINCFLKAIKLDETEVVFWKNCAYANFQKSLKISEEKEYFLNCAEHNYLEAIKREKNVSSGLLIDIAGVYFEQDKNDIAGEKIDCACTVNSEDYRDSLWMSLSTIKDAKIRYALYSLYYQVLKLRGEFEYIGNGPFVHYSGINGLIKLLQGDGNFRLSNVAHMDDLSEGRIFYELLKEKVKKISILGCTNLSYDVLPKIRNAYIMSLSEKEDDFNMWKSYGDAGKGCAIFFKREAFGINYSFELTAEEKQVVCDKNNNLPYKLQYVNHTNFLGKGEKIINKICSILNEIFEYTNIESNSSLIIDILDRVAFLYKRDDCYSDKEIRVVKYSDLKKAQKSDNYLEHGRSPKLFIPVDLVKYIDKIVLGSAIEYKESLAQFLYSEGIEKIEVSKVKIQ